MNIWKKPISLDILNNLNRGNSGEYIGIEFITIEDNSLTARLPVDHRTVQPWGIVHGGMNVFLAETLGSIGAYYATGPEFRCIGVDVNANHLLSARKGFVIGTAYPLSTRPTMHVWAIEIKNQAGHLTCMARMTVAILKNKRKC